MAANRLVEWLPDSLASERPSTPGQGVYLHRATDSGAITLWDGAAWRAWPSSGGGGDAPTVLTLSSETQKVYAVSEFPRGVRWDGFASGSTGRWVGSIVSHVRENAGSYFVESVYGADGITAIVTVNISTGVLKITFGETVTGRLLITEF
jgi:hypothetical protein